MNNRSTDLLERLPVDGSISAVVRTYESSLKKPLKTRLYSRIGFVLTSFVSLTGWVLNVSGENVNQTLANLVSVGLSLSGVALGLGLAGIAIYSSSLKPETIKAMVLANYPETNTSLLRVILASFVYVIVAFLKLVVVCTAYYLLFSNNSFVLEMIVKLFDQEGDARLFFSVFFFPIFSYYFIFAFSNLWSFVFNLHLTFLTIAAAEIKILEQKDKGNS